MTPIAGRASRRVAPLAALAVAVVLSSCGETPRPGPGAGGGWGPRDAYQRNWNPSSVETVTGAVVRVERIRPAAGMDPGVALFVRTPRLPLTVHLGPAWYLDRQEIAFAPGDTIVARGSLVTIGGELTLIAARVIRGDEALLLRDDDDGAPAWSAWRRRR